MPVTRRGALRSVLTIVLLVAGALLAHKLGDDSHNEDPGGTSATLFNTPELKLQYGRSLLSISASTTSAAHEAALLELITDQFAGTIVETEFRDGLLLKPEWETISTRLLYVVATTASATVAVGQQEVSIHAITEDLERFQTRLASLESALSNDIQLVSEVVAVRPDVELRDLCARHFATITAASNVDQALRFRQASTVPSESANALLDRLAEFAYDCQDHQITIVGHTDSTGTESWNLQVSKARAQAVAAQLIQRGVADDRVLAEGRGSQSPLAKNDSVQGRARNRRIEFELR